MKTTLEHFISPQEKQGSQESQERLKVSPDRFKELAASAKEYLCTPKCDQVIDEIETECSQALQELSFLESKSHAECLERYNQAYMLAHRQQTSLLQDVLISDRIRQEISTLQSKLNAKYYGWKHKPWNPASETSHDMYESLVQAENHSFPLEEPALSQVFFENIGSYASRDDIQRIDPDLATRAAVVENNEMLRGALTARSLEQGNRARFQEESNQDDEDEVDEADDDDDESTLYNSQTPNHNRSRSLSFPQGYHRQLYRQAYRPRQRRSTVSRPSSHLVVPSSRKTSSQIRLERELQEREAALRSELATQFKANPIPASTLLPRYHKIKLVSSTRASEARERRAKQLMEQSRPFAFQPQREKSANRVHERDAKVDETIKKALQEISKLHAKKEHTRLGYREPSLIVKNAAKDGVERRKRLEEASRQEGLTKEHTFAPKINKNLPEFEKLQQEFAESKLNIKPKEPTVVQPFNLHQNERPPKKARSELNIDTSLAFRWPFVKTKRAEIAKDVVKGVGVPIHHTRTSLLKKQVIEEKAREEQAELIAKETKLKEKKRRSLQLGVMISSKSARSRPGGVNHIGAIKQQEEQYRKRLDEMEGRLRQRPFLFEVPNLPSKRKEENGEDVFAKIMKAAGLKPDAF